MSMEVLGRHWEDLRRRKNVINVALHTKIKDGKDTGTPAIVVYVTKKVAVVELTAEHLIPPEIEGVPTDVIELPSTGITTFGETEISKLHPAEQIKRLGANTGNPKVMVVAPVKSTPSGHSNLIKCANAIQNQESCGACLSFDYAGVWEGKFFVVNGILIKISEGHIFFCDPVASCNGGSSPDDIMTQPLKGVALLADCPYTDSDQACGTGLNPTWWQRGKKLTGQNAISDPVQQLVLLDTEPLVATFQVPQSFMNYTGGIYMRQGPNDPIVGGHGVGAWGYDRKGPVPYDIMRNQWDITWGQNCVIDGVPEPGWFMIDPALLDPVMYQLLLSTDPIPDPGPTPPPPNPPGRGCLLKFWPFGRRAKKSIP